MNRSDVHHVYPRNHLKKQGLARGRYNQIANFVLAQSEINIAIGDKAPEMYFEELAEQCAGGKKKYGGITERAELRANLRDKLSAGVAARRRDPTYDDFLEAAPQAHGAEDQDLVRSALVPDAPTHRIFLLPNSSFRTSPFSSASHQKKVLLFSALSNVAQRTSRVRASATFEQCGWITQNRNAIF